MKKTVYFEIYGKKMKTIVEASNNQEAEDFIKNQIIFHEIRNTSEEELKEPEKSTRPPIGKNPFHTSNINDIFTNFNDMFGGDINKKK